MDNNQNERKSINLSKDAGSVREAYPRYNNSTSDSQHLQQQEYRNSPGQTTQYQEMNAPGSQYNAPPVQPANASNPPAQFQNQFGHYYDYNDPQTNNQYQNGPQNNMYQNGPQNPQNHYQNGPQNPQNPQNHYQNGPQKNLYNNPLNNMYQNQARNNAAPQNQPGYQQQAMKFCKYCGDRIPGDAIVCTHCGRQVEEFVAPNRAAGTNNVTIMNTPPYAGPAPGQQPYGMSNVSAKSKTTAIILAAIGFFGFAGLHRFYSGKILSGLLYLCTWGLFGIGTLVDILRLASNTFTDGAGYLIKNQ